MLLLTSLLACASTTPAVPDEVVLTWHQEHLACAGGVAEWDADEGALAVSVVRYEAIEAGDYTVWQTSVATEAGTTTVSIPCQDDVVLLYALAG